MGSIGSGKHALRESVQGAKHFKSMASQRLVSALSCNPYSGIV